MTKTEEVIDTFTSLIADLYDHLLVIDIPDDAQYRGFLDRDKPFALDNHGYRISYIGILNQAFMLPNIGERWSEDGLQKLGHDLLLKLAEYKARAFSPDFKIVAAEWLAKVDVEFEQQACYTPVVGMTVESSFQIGDVTFLPLDVDRPELKADLATSFLDEFIPNRDCLSFSTVVAEWRRSAEIHRQRTHKALNVLRFIASLVWYDQPTRHIYVAGRNPKRVSYSIIINQKRMVSQAGASEFSPVPLRVDSEFLTYANFYGFDHIQSLIRSSSLTEIEESFLAAVQWYGEATQDLTPLVSFVKYYVSIESALKKEGERAKAVLPKRISVLIEPWNKERQRTLQKDLGDIIDERNSVLHSGRARASSPEYLTWSGQIIARQALHQLHLRIKSGAFQTKDDVIRWVDDQYIKYLK